MTLQRLTRFIQFGAFLVAFTSTSIAWSQSSSEGGSLADRIRDLRRGMGDSAIAADDTAVTTPLPGDQPAPRVHPSAPVGQGGLPQINAKSLIPSNLFGRPSVSVESREPQPMPAHEPSTTVKKIPAAIDQ